jgi:DNA recombination protein RmuC
MDNNTIIIICVAAGVGGLLIGFIIARLLSSSKIASLRTTTESQAEQIAALEAEKQQLTAQTETLRINLEETTSDKIKAQSRWEEQSLRLASVEREKEGIRAQVDNLQSDLLQSREGFAKIKAQHDDLYKANIEHNNERNRTKDLVEQLRVKENELNKTIAGYGAAYDELKKQEISVGENLSNLQKEYKALTETNTALVGENNSLAAKYGEAQKAIEAQKLFVAEAQKALKETFDSLSAQALKQNNQSFLDLAKTALEAQTTEAKGELEQKKQAIEGLVKPLSESLKSMDEKINTLETKREGAYSNISTLLDQVKLSNMQLDKETRNLVTALKSSNTRGRYGEIALRRLVEFAGMLGRLRPDMIIKMPGSRTVVVDSKVPLAAYLSLFETEDVEEQKLHNKRHVEAIKTHLKQLSGKAYWDQFAEAPDFVVLFMQIESSYVAALQFWPALIEEAMKNRVIIATPTTLVTILRSIGFSWNQLKTMENIEQIRNAAVELYDRSVTLLEHLINMGKGISSTVNHYNKAVGSLENNFLPQGRKIQSLSQAYIKKQLPEVSPVEVAVRAVTALPPSATDNL